MKLLMSLNLSMYVSLTHFTFCTELEEREWKEFFLNRLMINAVRVYH